MIINEELFAIESQCERMLALIRNSVAMHTFKLAKEALEDSEEAQEKIRHFNHIKTEFEKIEAYGSYAPGFKELRTKLFASKREMDLDDVIYNYRIAERDLQVQLDLIAKKLATAVSENILVSAGDAFSLSMIGLPAACEIHLGKRKDIEL
ncbi:MULTISPECIES: YlbF family regulator [unclassified Jeotgalibaca]|uniref:YlbF family regulator n=1 Tax=unclassified Jeotgalibaca TaxID=2621505 RepID=UPI003FD28145